MTVPTLIEPAELARLQEHDHIVVVDVRHDLASPLRWGRDSYVAWHIPGAVFAHLDEDLSGTRTGSNGRHPLPSPAETAARFGRLGIDGSRPVVAYDQHNGMIAARLWWMLRWLGHDDVRVLDGGFARWEREHRPVEPGERPPRGVAFRAASPGRVADAAWLLAELPRGRIVVVDARAAERYRGDVEPLDPVAGHIPGALNHPFSRNLHSDGTFRPAGELRTMFETLLGSRAAGDVVHQCGSGVSACHNLLAMEHAGLSGSLLYPGSWSEWCAAATRPVARGPAPYERAIT